MVSATEELKQETEKILQESDDTKQEVSRVNGNFKMEYTQLTQDINNFEILTKELR